MSDLKTCPDCGKIAKNAAGLIIHASMVHGRRVQRQRGEKLPPNTVYVGRPTVWGNPFGWLDRMPSIQQYGLWLAGDVRMFEARRARLLLRLPELRGKNLACWCPLSLPCHADVLLELANRAAVEATKGSEDQGRAVSPSPNPYSAYWRRATWTVQARICRDQRRMDLNDQPRH